MRSLIFVKNYLISHYNTAADLKQYVLIVDIVA